MHCETFIRQILLHQFFNHLPWLEETPWRYYERNGLFDFRNKYNSRPADRSNNPLHCIWDNMSNLGILQLHCNPSLHCFALNWTKTRRAIDSGWLWSHRIDWTLKHIVECVAAGGHSHHHLLYSPAWPLRIAYLDEFAFNDVLKSHQMQFRR